MSLSTFLTRFVICLRHGHDWVRAHRRDGSSYMRCQGCNDVQSILCVRNKINAFAAAKPSDRTATNHYMEMKA